jgi:hypothetical protein
MQNSATALNFLYSFLFEPRQTSRIHYITLGFVYIHRIGNIPDKANFPFNLGDVSDFFLLC